MNTTRPQLLTLTLGAAALAGLLFAGTASASVPNDKPATPEVVAGGPYGWVNANQPTTASYTPAAADQLNSLGAPNSVVRTALGTYSVTFPGLAANFDAAAPGGRGTVMVSPTNCRATSWAAKQTAIVVKVACMRPAGVFQQGQPADSSFSVGFTNRQSSVFFPVSFTLADQPSTASYVPDATTTYSYGSDVKITRNGLGSYAVLFKEFTSAPVVAKVSGYGDVSAECRIKSTTLVAAGTKVAVSCVDGVGAAADSKFIVQLAAKQNLFGDSSLHDGAASIGAGGGVGAAWNFRAGVGFLGQPTVTTDSLGARYHVKFPGQATQSKLTVHATTVTGGPKRCDASTVSTSGNDLVIDVVCYKGTQLSPTPFNLEFSGKA